MPIVPGGAGAVGRPAGGGGGPRGGGGAPAPLRDPPPWVLFRGGTPLNKNYFNWMFLKPGCTLTDLTRRTIYILVKDENVDAVISVFVEPIMVKALPVNPIRESVQRLRTVF